MISTVHVGEVCWNLSVRLLFPEMFNVHREIVALKIPDVVMHSISVPPDGLMIVDSSMSARPGVTIQT